MTKKVSGPKVVAFWGSLLAVLLILNAADHEPWVDVALWGWAVFVIWTTAFVVMLTNRRSPVHRGAFAWPTSASPALAFGLAVLLTGAAAVYGPWFGILVPVPVVFGTYLWVRDRKLRTRMLVSGAVDPKAPDFLPRAGQPREIPAWPEDDGKRAASS